MLLGLFGTALLYGDGVITPAISVLSAVEGLKVVEPSIESFVIPIAVGILIGLFAVQKRGTAASARSSARSCWSGSSSSVCSVSQTWWRTCGCWRR